MNAEQIKAWLGRAWKEKVSEVYKRGVISNKEMLLASMYDSLSHPSLPDVQVWLSQNIEFPPFREEDFLQWKSYHKKKELLGSRADMLISHQGMIKAVLCLNFAPRGYGDYRNDLDYLNSFHALRGDKGILLGIDPHTGKLNQRPYQIDEHLLLIYAVVNQEASMSLEMSTLKNHCKDPLFWYNFVLFQGIIGLQKIKFRMK